ncbi:MAG: YraN family protein [SAR324 cluster bacterium]|nr:YraN family protein [SAR324 cluster bacterium]
MSARKNLGIDGENLAAKYLENLGYSIVGRNFRHRLGEIDIVADYEGYLVVCEVKFRSSGKIDPSFSVTLAKRTKLRKLYEVFINRYPGKLRMQPRFDVILIILSKNYAPELEYIPNAL